jgi:hypothetical protein
MVNWVNWERWFFSSARAKQTGLFKEGENEVTELTQFTVTQVEEWVTSQSGLSRSESAVQVVLKDAHPSATPTSRSSTLRRLSGSIRHVTRFEGTPKRTWKIECRARTPVRP